MLPNNNTYDMLIRVRNLLACYAKSDIVVVCIESGVWEGLKRRGHWN